MYGELLIHHTQVGLKTFTGNLRLLVSGGVAEETDDFRDELESRGGPASLPVHGELIILA